MTPTEALIKNGRAIFGGGWAGRVAQLAKVNYRTIQRIVAAAERGEDHTAAAGVLRALGGAMTAAHGVLRADMERLGLGDLHPLPDAHARPGALSLGPEEEPTPAPPR